MNKTRQCDVCDGYVGPYDTECMQCHHYVPHVEDDDREYFYDSDYQIPEGSTRFAYIAPKPSKDVLGKIVEFAGLILGYIVGFIIAIICLAIMLMGIVIGLVILIPLLILFGALISL